MASNTQPAGEEVMKGGCHCGGIQLHFHKHVAQIFFCHCSMCRKIVGSTVNDFVGVALSKLVMTKDSTLAKYRSSNEATRSFCNNCGCSTGIQYDQEKHTFWLSRGVCDSDPGPGVTWGTSHVWIEEGIKATWDRVPDDGITRHLLDCQDYKWDPATDLLQLDKM